MTNTRNPAKRHEELRAFIAEERRHWREKKKPSSDSQSNDVAGDDNVNDHDEDDISGWTAARPSPSLAGAESSGVKSAVSSASHSPRPSALDALRNGFMFSARRKLAFEVDTEGRICGDSRRSGRRGSGEPFLGDGPAGHSRPNEGSPGGMVKSGEEKRGSSELPDAPGGEDVVNGARLLRQRQQSDDILAEHSTLESLVVDELHEVLEQEMYQDNAWRIQCMPSAVTVKMVGDAGGCTTSRPHAVPYLHVPLRERLCLCFSVLARLPQFWSGTEVERLAASSSCRWRRARRKDESKTTVF